MTVEEYLAQRYPSSSTSRYLRAIQCFEQVLGEASVQANFHTIVNYIGALRERGYSAGHLNTELQGIKKYYAWLQFTGQRVDNPAYNIKLNDIQSKDVQFDDLFSLNELELLLERPSRYALLENRNKAAMGCYIYLGLTTGELASLKLNDLLLDQETVIVRSSRKLNTRTLLLPSNLQAYVERYLMFERPYLLKGESDSLFITKKGVPEKGEGLHYLIESQRLLFPDRVLNPKTIRQSVIVNWFRQGKSIKEVQLLAGHKWPSTTERYKPVDLSDLKAALEQFFPLG